MQHKNITLVIDNLGSGGAQRQLVLLALELSALGHDITLLTYNENNHMGYMLESSSVKHVIIKSGSPTKLSKMIAVLRYLFAAQPKYLISYLDSPNIISAVYSLFSKNVTWLASERNLNTGTGAAALWRKLAFSVARKVISNSHAQQAWLQNSVKLPKSKVITIWNGVHADFFSASNERENKPASAIKFLSLGRLSYQKHPELLVDAIKQLKTLQGMEFDWFGSDDPDSPNKRTELQQNITDLPLTVHQPTSGAHELLSKADCLILTSRHEGTPNVVLEAMAAGVFVIVPSIVDLPIIIGDNERGIIFKANCVNSLTSAIESFASMNANDRIAVTKRASEFARLNFSSAALATNYLELLNNE